MVLWRPVRFGIQGSKRWQHLPTEGTRSNCKCLEQVRGRSRPQPYRIVVQRTGSNQCHCSTQGWPKCNCIEEIGADPWYGFGGVQSAAEPFVVSARRTNRIRDNHSSMWPQIYCNCMFLLPPCGQCTAQSESSQKLEALGTGAYAYTLHMQPGNESFRVSWR